MSAIKDSKSATPKYRGPIINLNENIVLHTQLCKIIANAA
jgi:hypothetical protein